MKTLYQISMFTYLGCEVTYGYGKDIYNELATFTRMCTAMQRTLNQSSRDLVGWSKVMTVLALYDSED